MVCETFRVSQSKVYCMQSFGRYYRYTCVLNKASALPYGSFYITLWDIYGRIPRFGHRNVEGDSWSVIICVDVL